MAGDGASCCSRTGGCPRTPKPPPRQPACPQVLRRVCPGGPWRPPRTLPPGLRCLFRVRWSGSGSQGEESGFSSSVSPHGASEAAAGAARVFGMRGNSHAHPPLPDLTPEPGPLCPPPVSGRGSRTSAVVPPKTRRLKSCRFLQPVAPFPALPARPQSPPASLPDPGDGGTNTAEPQVGGDQWAGPSPGTQRPGSCGQALPPDSCCDGSGRVPGQHQQMARRPEGCRARPRDPTATCSRSSRTHRGVPGWRRLQALLGFAFLVKIPSREVRRWSTRRFPPRRVRGRRAGGWGCGVGALSSQRC